ncbi:MAG: hypothetical protein N3A54_02990 [Patescibacteria group bacterium]|nr:hypothetical protein [Patescibacteria group bacterium]
MSQEVNKKLANYQQMLIDNKIDPLFYGGINNAKDFAPKPRLLQTSGEHVIEGESNARIVLGKDRNEGIESGYGGKGDSGCAAIDIVVEPVLSKYKPLDEKQFCNPSFQYDACRIYLSGKTNIDSYFNVPDPEELSKGKAGIAIFSDCTRIFARQDIRLVTGLSQENARGGLIFETYNIQLVGNNDFAKLQPAVLGNNLVNCAKDIVSVVDGVISMIDSLINLQLEYNKALAEHKHYSPFFGQPTTPSEIAMLSFSKTIPRMLAEMKTSIMSLRNKMASISNNYLSGTGGQNILSNYVELN